MRHPQIAARVFHTPLLVAPAKAAAFAIGFGPRLTGADVEVVGAEVTDAAQIAPQASLLDGRTEDEIRSGRRSGSRRVEGIAVIPVTGTLVHRRTWLGEFSGEASYEAISAEIATAVDDPSVRGIALELDSFGGEVAGCFSLADQIRSAREAKPVWAFVSDHAFSAGYAIASQATRIVMPRTAGVGSIGVIAMHADFSQQIEAMGVQVTVIAAGSHKADGNPYEPLPASVRESLQAEMESLRLIFAETVAAGRGARLDADGALATEAATYLGDAAVEAGLADEVANPREAFERFRAEVNGRAAPATVSASSKRTTTMTNKTDAPAATTEPTQPTAAAPGAPAPAASEPEQKPTATAPAAQEPQAAAPAGPTAEEERTRISAILNHPEAKGREELAKSLAFAGGMSAEEAGKHLAAAPKASATQSLSARMDAEATELDAPGPDVDASSGGIAARAKQRHQK